MFCFLMLDLTPRPGPFCTVLQTIQFSFSFIDGFCDPRWLPFPYFFCRKASRLLPSPRRTLGVDLPSAVCDAFLSKRLASISVFLSCSCQRDAGRSDPFLWCFFLFSFPFFLRGGPTRLSNVPRLHHYFFYTLNVKTGLGAS